MFELTEFEKKQIKLIASFYGCKVKFRGPDESGTWAGHHINLGKCKTLTDTISIFCHELAHFINWKTEMYPVYHNPKNFGRLHKIFKSKSLAAKYSLKAEIFTDRQGRKLCKEWFPSVTYRGFYNDTQYCYRFVYRYYMGFYP